MKLSNTDKKKELKLLRNFDKCRTRKCSNSIKKRNSVSNSFMNLQEKECPQKSSKAFYNCSTKFYEGSNLQKLSEDVVKCSDKKCNKQKKKLTTLRRKMYV